METQTRQTEAFFIGGIWDREYHPLEGIGLIPIIEVPIPSQAVCYYVHEDDRLPPINEIKTDRYIRYQWYWGECYYMEEKLHFTRVKENRIRHLEKKISECYKEINKLKQGLYIGSKL